MHFREPVVLVVISVVGALLPSIVVGEPELGVVSPEHGALLEDVLYRALMVWAGSFKHVVEEPWASGILVVRGRNEPGLENLLFPLASLLLFLGGARRRGPGGLIPPLPLGVVVGEDGPDGLFARGEAGGDVEECGCRGRYAPA